MSESPALSVQNAHAGRTLKRIRTLLYLIEGITNRLATGVWPVELVNELATRKSEAAYLSAFALNAGPQTALAIEQLNTYSEYWWPLIPDEPTLCAGLIHELSEKYPLAGYKQSPLATRLRAHDQAVQKAYQELYGSRIESVFASGKLDRVRSILVRRSRG